MQKKLLYTYILLLILTLAGATLSYFSVSKAVVAAIVVFSVTKFLMVAFEFMELKEANVFWKVVLSIYSAVMGIALIVLL